MRGLLEIKIKSPTVRYAIYHNTWKKQENSGKASEKIVKHFRGAEIARNLD